VGGRFPRICPRTSALHWCRLRHAGRIVRGHELHTNRGINPNTEGEYVSYERSEMRSQSVPEIPSSSRMAIVIASLYGNSRQCLLGGPVVSGAPVTLATRRSLVPKL
jgi:hypothetical protein